MLVQGISRFHWADEVAPSMNEYDRDFGQTLAVKQDLIFLDEIAMEGIMQFYLGLL